MSKNETEVLKNHKIAIFVHLRCQYTLSSALQDAFVCSVSQKCAIADCAIGVHSRLLWCDL